MRSATNRVPIFARLLSCTLALGSAVLLGLPTSASAATILNFGQNSPTDFVSATVSGSTLTLDTHGVSNPLSPTSIPILVTQLGNVPIPSGAPAFETFVGVTSSAAQTGFDKPGFAGEIIISSAPATAGFGVNILTTTFSGGTLSVPSLSSGSLNDAEPPNTVTFTTADSTVAAALGGFSGVGNYSLAFTNITPPQPGTFTDFVAQNAGLFATGVIPEPASIVMTGMGLMSVFGYGLLRRKSSKV